MNEENYDYYFVPSNIRDELDKKYEEEILGPRKAVFDELLLATGAIAWTENKNWGEVSTIRSLAFHPDHELVGASYMTKPKFDQFEGSRVAIIRGKQSVSLGRDFNNLVVEANKKLKDLPDYRQWLVVHFKVMRTGFGAATGRGVSMLSTNAGHLSDGLGFAIPKGGNEKHGTIEIPDCFEKLTYGQWYDLIKPKTEA
ncbi:DUF5420 family protein [Vibrio sp. ER1A]|uniref:DUF5420 family protein n=1 Tax=Vibrio sp. ER1A TaxID=1517681 RepID=UPI000691D2D0|nr:DUF5420 family protein [Vibrio sp. ER1A]